MAGLLWNVVQEDSTAKEKFDKIDSSVKSVDVPSFDVSMAWHMAVQSSNTFDEAILTFLDDVALFDTRMSDYVIELKLKVADQ